MKVLAISGSPRPASRTLRVTALVAELLRRDGASVDVWDLAIRPLPVADPAYHQDPAQHPDPTVGQLVEAADAADALILASPVYHNSYSGVLKNALDNLSIAQFRHKPVGLIAFGGGLSAIQVCDHLRIVARGLLAIAVPAQIVAVPTDFLPAVNGTQARYSAELVQRGRRVAGELTMFARSREEKVT